MKYTLFDILLNLFAATSNWSGSKIMDFFGAFLSAQFRRCRCLLSNQ